MLRTQENLLTDGEGSAGDGDDQEVTDECAMLINTDHIYKHSQVKPGPDKSTGIFKDNSHYQRKIEQGFQTYYGSILNQQLNNYNYIIKHYSTSLWGNYL